LHQLIEDGALQIVGGQPSPAGRLKRSVVRRRNTEFGARTGSVSKMARPFPMVAPGRQSPCSGWGRIDDLRLPTLASGRDLRFRDANDQIEDRLQERLHHARTANDPDCEIGRSGEGAAAQGLLLRRHERGDRDCHGEEDEGPEHPAKSACPFLDRHRSRSCVSHGASRPSAPVHSLEVAQELVEGKMRIMEGRMDHAIPTSCGSMLGRRTLPPDVRQL
jgi:hypothetical protein